ncbi:adventurous gliding motility lipoprotein CglD [Archangium primigenium]|uniref:adventurous gliding motility lipoprotein CglD n=1 Tax=[Archangium] primigenium TaxID=2792470 RepID=UPI00195EF55A|nr:adventurous gliding motility lipoprotein CglD [Archangium primigenium]MBM7115807.1 VWA domain-containing protein [Archangium primigenium]
MRASSRFVLAALVMTTLVTGCGDDPVVNPPIENPEQDGGGTQTDGGSTEPVPDAGPVEPPTFEDPFGPPPGPRNPTNAKIDTDCDGLSDAEEFGNIYTGNKKTDPDKWDTDGDGIRDGVEAGRTSTLNTLAQCAELFMADMDPSTRTNPTNPDTDGDGLRDGLEDTNHNGRLDPGETDPANLDTDGDGLSDGDEDVNKNGRVDPGETDPRLRDTDGDGLSDFTEVNITRTNPTKADSDGDSCADGAEDLNGNGIKDPGETDPNDPTDCGAGSFPDSDKDGVPDYIEEATGTDKNNPDTDGDGLNDGLEDRNRNGIVDTGETDPRKKDSDCDGLVDGPSLGGFRGEDLNANGVKDSTETDPSKRDTDGDGLLDGVELGIPATSAPDSSCGYPGDQDPSTKTDPLKPDTDGDGIADGAEDSNQNGRKDPGELDPLDRTDGAGSTPAGQACSATNLRQITFKEDGSADIRLALRNSFQEVRQITVGGSSKGYIGYDDTNKVTFIAYKRGKAGSSTTVAGDEAYVRGQFYPSVTAGTLQTFTTWDGHPALQAFYDFAQGSGTPINLRDYTNSVANTLVGSGAGTLTGGTGSAENYKLQAQYVHRSDASVLVVIAITPQSRFVEPGLFVMNDTAGGTALAQFGDADAVQCETFTTGNGMADFLFVVDDSGSMATSQNALGEAATAVANRLGNSQLDWRIAMVSTSYTQTGYGLPTAGVFRGFTRDIQRFKWWLQQSSSCTGPSTDCWIGVSGSSDEKTLESARAAVDYMTNASSPADKKFRPGARLIVIVLTDVRDTGDVRPVSTYIDYFKGANPTGALIQMHGIICDSIDGGECYPGEPINDLRHKEVIQATGGITGSIRNTASIQSTIGSIMDSAIASSGYRTLKPPIGASVRVAMQAVQDGALCNKNDLPRSRVNGFDVDGISQALAFYGACRPATAGSTTAAISYRYWSDLTGNKDGNPPPCSTDTAYFDSSEADFCRGKLACNRQTNRCECAADCGGNAPPGKVCNSSREVCDFTCGAECGGACGSFQACNAATCTCQCVASATCAPGFRFDAAACGCVCDTAALNCGAAYRPDAASCACICQPNCGNSCGEGYACNSSTCACEPKLN